MRRCEKRGVDLHLPHIVAYARLALAKFALLHHPHASKTDGLSARGALTEGGSPVQLLQPTVILTLLETQQGQPLYCMHEDALRLEKRAHSRAHTVHVIMQVGPAF